MRLLPWLCFLAPLAAAQERYTSTEYGLSLVPPPGWVCYGGDGTDASVAHQVACYPRGVTGGVPSLLVQVYRWSGSPGAVEMRDLALAGVAGRPGYDAVSKGERELAGGRWPTIACKTKAPDGRTLVVECAYVTAPGLAYALTGTVAEDDAAGAEQLAAVVASFKLGGDAETAKLRELAGRCGQDLPWAATWDQAEARARAERRLILVVYEQFSILQIPHTAASGPLSDPDLAALLQERFVVLRLRAEDPAAFRPPERYGLSRWSWGSSLLFVSPEGEVLRESGTNDPVCVEEVARQALAAAPAATGPGGAIPSNPEEAATRALRRGELEAALRLLEQRSSARAHLLRAMALRRQRDGEAALRSLAAARRAGPTPDEAREIAAEEALVNLRLGRGADASRGFLGVAADAANPRRGEALWWLGTIHALNTGDLKGGGYWQRIVDELPEGRWAAKAAANLLGTGAMVNGAELPTWPAAGVLAEAAPIPSAPLEPTKAAEGRRGARAFLLGSQRPDGAWGVPTEDLSLVRMGYAEAVTSIAAGSLIAHLREPGVRPAVERALARILLALREGVLAPGADATQLAGSYRSWARTYALRFLVRCSAAGVGKKDELRPAIDALLKAVLERQGKAGGWPYVSLATDPQGDGMASSFLTGAVVLTLCEAKEEGIAVPPQAFTRAAEFLMSLREEDGSFRYAPDVPGHQRGEDKPEAAGRSPLCALALHAALRTGGGEGDLPGIRRALGLFLTHRSVLEDQRGKDLCHTGPDGQASYYFAFDHAYAAQAVAALPEAERASFAGPIRRGILAARTTDGSFVDMPGLGRPYATGMLLEGLAALGD